MSSSSSHLAINNSTALPSSQPFTGRPLNHHLREILILVGTGVLASGVLGNVLMLVVMYKRRKVERFRNVFIANLALADLVVTCVALPYFLLDLLLGRYPAVSNFHCMLNAFVWCTSYAVSILSLLLVSCHRYVKVCHPRLFHIVFTKKRDPLYCVALWWLAAVFNLPLFGLVPPFGYDRYSHTCSPRASRTYPCFGSIAEILMLIIPLVLIGYFNGAIFFRQRGSRRRLHKRSQDGLRAAKETGSGYRSFQLDDRISVDTKDTCSIAGLRRHETLRTDCASDLLASVVCEAVRRHDGEGGTGFSAGRRDPVQSGRTITFRADVSPPTCDPKAASGENQTTNNRRRDARSHEAHTRWSRSLAESRKARDTAPRDVPTRLQTVAQVTGRSKGDGAGLRPDSYSVTAQIFEGVRSRLTQASRTSQLVSALDLTTSPSLRLPGLPSSAIEESESDASAGFPCDEGYTLGAEYKWRKEEYVTRNSASLLLDSPLQPKRKGKGKVSLYPSLDRTNPERFFAWRRRKAGRKSKDLALLRSLLVITACLFILYIPFVITIILIFVLKDDVPAELPVTATLLLFVNCGINWIIYGVMNTAIRQAYVTTLKSCASCCLKTWRNQRCWYC